MRRRCISLTCLSWKAVCLPDVFHEAQDKPSFCIFKHSVSTRSRLPYAVIYAKQSTSTCQCISKLTFFPRVLMKQKWSLKPYPKAQPKAFSKCLLYDTSFTAPCFPALYPRLFFFFQNEIITNHPDAWIESWTWLFMRQNITLISRAPGTTGSLFSLAA